MAGNVPSVRSALAPPLRTLLEQAVHPGEDDALDDAVEDIISGRAKLLEHREVCDEADSYYDGDLGMVWASVRVEEILAKQGGLEDIHDFNYAAIPVDRIAARLQISSVVAGPSDENEGEKKRTEDAGTSAATKAIAKLRKDNELDAEEKRLHHEVSKYGEGYLLVWPGFDADGKPSVDMRVNSAYHVIMVYDPEDPLRPMYALKCWEREVDGKPCERANLYYPDRIERWTTDPGGNPDKKEAWKKLVDPDLDVDDEDMEELAADEFTDPDDDAGTGDEDSDEQRGVTLQLGDIANPWDRVPFFHYRNNRPHGRPEHQNAYGPQQLINKLVWGLAGTIDYTAFPQRYLLMDPSVDDPMSNVSDPDHPDEDDDDVETEGGNAGLDASPGSVWKLWGKTVGEFTAADSSSFLASLDRIVRSMAELTGLPVDAFSRDSASIPSGESRREANADFIAIVTDRQDRYDPVWQDAYEFALKMLGITNVTVDVRWKPAQMVNDLAGWNVIQAKINAGVPPKVALEEAGYPPEQVDEWLKDATGADLGRRVALLNQIATATQALGASIVTGAVSAEQVQAIISALFMDTMAGTEHDIPEAKEFLDPLAAQKMALEQQATSQDSAQGHQADLQKAQLDHAKDSQGAQLEHATGTQQTAQDFQRQMAEEGHQRAKEMMGAQEKAQKRQPGAQRGTGRTARGPKRGA